MEPTKQQPPRLVIDSNVLAQLNKDAATPVELYDETGQCLGRLVGHFIPTPAGDPEGFALARAAFTPDVIEKALNESGGRPLSEIRAKLERS